jgi:hypothetical protein
VLSLRANAEDEVPFAGGKAEEKRDQESVIERIRVGSRGERVELLEVVRKGHLELGKELRRGGGRQRKAAGVGQSQTAGSHEPAHMSKHINVAIPQGSPALPCLSLPSVLHSSALARSRPTLLDPFDASTHSVRAQEPPYKESVPPYK